jgi:hypothetical protein
VKLQANQLPHRSGGPCLPQQGESAWIGLQAKVCAGCSLRHYLAVSNLHGKLIFLTSRDIDLVVSHTVGTHPRHLYGEGMRSPAQAVEEIQRLFDRDFRDRKRL